MEHLNKQCSKCKEIKNINQFYVIKGLPSYACKDCYKIIYKKYRENNRERIRIRQREWRNNNKKRHIATKMENIEYITKQCGKCKEIKNINEFCRAQLFRSGWCRTCHNIYSKKYRENNKEYIAIKRLEYNSNNKEKRRSQQKKYRDNNKEKILIRHREWVNNNKEKEKLTQKKYRQNNKEKIANDRKKWANNNKEKISIAYKNYSKRNTEELRDQYIKISLKAYRFPSIPKDVLKELIDLKRDHLKFKRAIKEKFK